MITSATLSTYFNSCYNYFFGDLVSRSAKYTPILRHELGDQTLRDLDNYIKYGWSYRDWEVPEGVDPWRAVNDFESWGTHKIYLLKDKPLAANALAQKIIKEHAFRGYFEDHWNCTSSEVVTQTEVYQQITREKYPDLVGEILSTFSSIMLDCWGCGFKEGHTLDNWERDIEVCTKLLNIPDSYKLDQADCKVFVIGVLLTFCDMENFDLREGAYFTHLKPIMRFLLNKYSTLQGTSTGKFLERLIDSDESEMKKLLMKFEFKCLSLSIYDELEAMKCKPAEKDNIERINMINDRIQQLEVLIFDKIDESKNLNSASAESIWMTNQLIGLSSFIS